ncbi:MAG TPA: tRNA lysidine(34) synthetase TilS, partial [Anaerolineaceae bacterium]
GLAGLKGMQACTRLPQLGGSVPLARPLLETWREETVAYCREHLLDPVVDPSNADTTFFRNRLRHELIPSLQGYNPRVKEVLLRMASSLAGDQAFLEEAAQAAWDAGSPSRGEGYSSFDREAFLRLPVSLQRRVLRRMVADLRPELRDLDFETVERAAGFFREPPATFHMDLVDGLDLDTQLGWVILHEHGVEPRMEQWPCLPAGTSVSLEVPGSVDLGAGWLLEAGLSGEGLPEGAGSADPNQAWLDARRIRLPLTVRCRAEGDRFTPFGMGGRSVKLSDYFINVKIPRSARATWPLVFAGEELAWVPGYRSSEAFRVSPPAGPVIHLVLRKK